MLLDASTTKFNEECIFMALQISTEHLPSTLSHTTGGNRLHCAPAVLRPTTKPHLGNVKVQRRTVDIAYLGSRCRFRTSSRVILGSSQLSERSVFPENAQASWGDIFNAIAPAELHASLELLLVRVEHELHAFLSRMLFEGQHRVEAFTD